MSALPPKADIAERCHHVRFVPSKLKSGAAAAIAAPAVRELLRTQKYVTTWLRGRMAKRCD